MFRLIGRVSGGPIANNVMCHTIVKQGDEHNVLVLAAFSDDMMAICVMLKVHLMNYLTNC